MTNLPFLIFALSTEEKLNLFSLLKNSKPFQPIGLQYQRLTKKLSTEKCKGPGYKTVKPVRVLLDTDWLEPEVRKMFPTTRSQGNYYLFRRLVLIFFNFSQAHSLVFTCLFFLHAVFIC